MKNHLWLGLPGVLIKLITLYIGLWVSYNHSVALAAQPNQWQNATVVVEGAIVYRKADFDSSVMAYLKLGEMVKISRKVVGAFYKVQTERGTGYISDIDVHVSGAKTAMERETNFKQNSTPSRRPIFMTKYFGFSGGLLHYSDNVLGQDVSDNIMIYGIKLSGPGIILEPPFITDFNVNFSFEAPRYFSTYLGIKPTGWMMTVDMLLLFPLRDSEYLQIYFGAGPLVVYSNFKAVISGQLQTLSNSRVGASLVAGLALRLGAVILKIEPKYLLEKKSHLGYFGSVQYEF